MFSLAHSLSRRPVHCREATRSYCFKEAWPPMTKYWYTATTKDGKPVALYVETYEAAIKHDLDQGQARSLIHSVWHGDIPADEHVRHHALALGAFKLHVRAPGFTPIGEIYEAESIPPGLGHSWTGGTLREPQTCAVVVYEYFV